MERYYLFSLCLVSVKSGPWTCGTSEAGGWPPAADSLKPSPFTDARMAAALQLDSQWVKQSNSSRKNIIGSFGGSPAQ